MQYRNIPQQKIETVIIKAFYSDKNVLLFFCIIIIIIIILRVFTGHNIITNWYSDAYRQNLIELTQTTCVWLAS